MQIRFSLTSITQVSVSNNMPTQVNKPDPLFKKPTTPPPHHNPPAPTKTIVYLKEKVWAENPLIIWMRLAGN